jgi:hypothetical protein
MSESKNTFLRLPGGQELVNWFGEFYDFHDAEIVSLTLNRHSTSHLKVHGYFRSQDDNGHTFSNKEAIVTFEPSGVFDLQLDGFNHQNVIGGLAINKIEAGRARRPHLDSSFDIQGYELHLEPCYGMDGVIRCSRIAIALEPGRPKDDETE